MRTVSTVTAAAVAVGIAVHVLGELLANLTLARVGGTVALLALAGYALTATPRVRWPLVGGLLVFAIGAASALVWDEFALRPLPPSDCAECFRRLLVEPDLAGERLVALLALAGTVAIAVSVGLAPDRADRRASAATAITVVLALVAGEVVLFALAAGDHELPAWGAATIGPVLPALLATGAAIVAGVYAAARTRPAAIWVGLVVLSVPALIRAAFVSGQVATASTLGDVNTVTPQLVTRDDDVAVLAVVFTTAQLVALALITVGAARLARPAQGIRATAP